MGVVLKFVLQRCRLAKFSLLERVYVVPTLGVSGRTPDETVKWS
jgi:hypothetical protein